MRSCRLPLNVVVLRDSGALLAFYDFLPPRCYRNYLCRSARQGKMYVKCNELKIVIVEKSQENVLL